MIIQILVISAVTFIANIIGTVSGFGIGTIMTPVLMLFLPFTEAILFVCILHWFHDVWKLFLFKRSIDWELFWYFGLPTIFASMLGASLVVPEQSVLLTSLFGLFIIGTLIMMFCLPNFELANNWISGLIGGSISGFFAGLFGVRGAVRSLFLVGMDVQKERLLATTGLISLCLDSSRLIVYYLRGLSMPTDMYLGLILFVPISFVGAFWGRHIIGRISQKHFRIIVALFLLIVGLKLLLFPWVG